MEDGTHPTERMDRGLRPRASVDTLNRYPDYSVFFIIGSNQAIRSYYKKDRVMA